MADNCKGEPEPWCGICVARLALAPIVQVCDMDRGLSGREKRDFGKMQVMNKDGSLRNFNGTSIDHKKRDKLEIKEELGK